MGGLPSWVFVAVGVIVAVISWKIPSLTIFFYVGMLFVVIGVFKLAKSYTVGDVVDKKDMGITSTASKKHPEVTFCPKCRIPVYVTSNFCHHCGNRLK